MKLLRGISWAVAAAAVALAGLAIAAPPSSAAPDSSPAPRPPGTVAKPATPLDPAAQAKSNYDLATAPGPQQKALEQFVGHWTSHVSMQMDPTKPAEESTGTADGEMILGGRFVQVIHKGTVMGQPFEGRMLCGYDNVAKKYVASWVDNLGTSIVHYDGTYDKVGKRLLMGATFIDPMSRKPIHVKSVTSFLSATSWTYDEYIPGADGKDRKTMTITFKKG